MLRRRRAFHVHGGAPAPGEAHAGEQRAQRQEQRLLEYFLEHPGARLTRHQAAEVLGCLEVSAGRALANLRDAGYLRKLIGVRVAGPHGATAHPYELVEGQR